MFCSLTSLSCSFSGLLAAESYLLGASAMTVTSLDRGVEALIEVPREFKETGITRTGKLAAHLPGW